MIQYNHIKVSNINDQIIKQIYSKLLKDKLNFMIIQTTNKKWILTKEMSLIETNDLSSFLKQANQDIYYKTITNTNETINYSSKDLERLYQYINLYKDKLNKKYNDYCFGCIAVRTSNNSFITTIRGKKNLEEYTIVEKVDNNTHTIYTNGKKATLNAPLLNQLFENKKVKTIVHIHEFNESLPYYDYAFPGTIRDSIRKNNTSFNIKYHGSYLLFDQNNHLL